MASSQSLLKSFAALSLLVFATFLFRRLTIPRFSVRFRAHASPGRPTEPSNPPSQQQAETLALYKQLYYKLHNLEDHPEVAAAARSELVALLSRARVFGRVSAEGGVLSCGNESYAPNSLREALQNQQDEVFDSWEQITTPFLFRNVIKNVWQVFSEEYGDGDLDKHHTHIYHRLVQGVAPELPTPEQLDFLDAQHGMNDVAVWRAAVVRLAISMFPHEFLPEILGYNLHFEAVKLETLIAAHELRELGIDASYFALHISIDNADSGHTAMALHAAEQYLEIVATAFGADAQKRAWRRLQTGFALSEHLEQDTPAPAHSLSSATVAEARAVTEAERKVIAVILAKAASAGRLHCASGVRLGGRKLAEWLAPGFLAAEPERQTGFMRQLARMRHWVHPGSSEKSRLVRELSWGGRMFGAFTDSEVEAVRSWIESLGEGDEEEDARASPESGLSSWLPLQQHVGAVEEYFGPPSGHAMAEYASFSAFTPSMPLPLMPTLYTRCKAPVHTCSDEASAAAARQQCQHSAHRLSGCPCSSALDVADAAADVDVAKLLPVWFMQSCLLQPLISVPFRSASRARCALLQLLRAQAGFGAEGPGVAGKDEVRRGDVVGLVDLGLRMAAAAAFAEPQSPADSLQRWPSEFANAMLRLSLCPERNSGLLVGLAWAFVDLHDAIVSPRGGVGILSQGDCTTLASIARRERECLVKCIDALGREGVVYEQVLQAHTWGCDNLRLWFQ